MLTYGRIFLFISVFACCSSITVRNGRYEDIYIVINECLPEDLELIDRIQEVFTNASRLLFEATNNRVYFGDIKIVIPSTWSPHENYTSSPTISSLHQYIAIETSAVNAPQVIGLDQCGQGGEVMSLPPEFLKETEYTKYGLHANVIVHEWGHLRWGLFDEYPTIYRGVQLKQFCELDGRWEPITCTESIEGSVGVGASCQQSCTTFSSLQISSDCNFCPDINQNVSASLMSYPTIKKLTNFCDNSDDPSVSMEMKHNKKAVNRHNLKCEHRSAWEIMREHCDFSEGANPPQSESTDTSPTFTLIHETAVYRVLVLDVSGSMEGERLYRLRQASSYILQVSVPLYSFIAIVTFSTLASTSQSLTFITSTADRDMLEAKLPTIADGSTCIGCGIEQALEELRTELTDLRKSDIIVISDGENNEGTLEVSVQAAVDAGVVVHTVSVSQAAQPTLGDIAESTGGQSFYWTEGSLIGLTVVMSQIIGESVSDCTRSSLQLVAESEPSSENVSFDFDIDEGIGRDTKVSVLAGANTNIVLVLNGPNNFTQAKQASNVNMLTLSIPDNAMMGQYHVNATSAVNTSLEYYVNSYPLQNATGPVRLKARLASGTVDLSQNKLPIIYAYMTRGNVPVAGAIVTVLIEALSKSCVRELHDNGMDPDDVSNDGKYSVYILRDCLDNGRIGIKVTATSNGSAFLNTKGLHLAPDFTSDIDTSKEVGKFQRISLPGELIITNYVDEIKDVTPPGRITDLDVINTTSQANLKEERRNSTIIWTATGDDMSYGQASSYEFRFSKDIRQLIDNFTGADMLPFLGEYVIPNVTGQSETFTVSVSATESFTTTTFLAVVVIDEEGNRGEVSNIVPITVASKYNITADVNVYVFEEGTHEVEPEDIPLYIIIIIVVAIAFVIGVVITAIIVHRTLCGNSEETADFGPENIRFNRERSTHIIFETEQQPHLDTCRSPVQKKVVHRIRQSKVHPQEMQGPLEVIVE